MFDPCPDQRAIILSIRNERKRIWRNKAQHELRPQPGVLTEKSDKAAQEASRGSFIEIEGPAGQQYVRSVLREPNQLRRPPVWPQDLLLSLCVPISGLPCLQN
jgi:hypothetical protein